MTDTTLLPTIDAEWLKEQRQRSEMAEFVTHPIAVWSAVLDALDAAWNRRDQWRTDWENAPKNKTPILLGSCHKDYPPNNYSLGRFAHPYWRCHEGMYTDAEITRAYTHYMLITPPAPVSGGK